MSVKELAILTGESVVKPFNVFLIPYWIEEMLKAQQVSLSVLTDYEELSKHLSHEAMVELLAFQTLDLVHAKPEQLNGATGLVVLAEAWRSVGGSVVETLINEAVDRAGKLDYMLALSQKVGSPPEHAGSDYSPLSVVDLKGENIGIVVNGGYQRLSNREFYVVLQNVLRVLYMYETTVKVVTRPIFRLYVETMTRNRAAG